VLLLFSLFAPAIVYSIPKIFFPFSAIFGQLLNFQEEETDIFRAPFHQELPLFVKTVTHAANSD
jgi:hypothetical protein